jgi:hypothetical protein
MKYKRNEHPYPDNELMGYRPMADLLGVTKRTMEVCVESGRVDRFEDSRGIPRFHQVLTPQQFHQNKVTSKVSTPTRGQAAAGMDGLSAQAVAHLPLTNPGASPLRRNYTQHAVTSGLSEDQGWDPTKGPLDLTIPDKEKRELAVSRAEKERFQGRLIQLKVLEKEGTLLDKSIFYQKAYTLGSSIKDKLNGLPSQTASQVVAAMEEALVSSGMPVVQARELLSRANMEHTVREQFRQGVTRALRDLTSRPMEELIRE